LCFCSCACTQSRTSLQEPPPDRTGLETQMCCRLPVRSRSRETDSLERRDSHRPPTATLKAVDGTARARPSCSPASYGLGFRRAQLGGSGGKPAQGSRTFTAPITLQAASMDGTNALILPCKRKKTVQGKAKNGKKNRQDPKISKTKLKKLQKLEEEKQKRLLQARSFEIFRNHKISIDEYSLLHASATIGQV